MEARRNRRVLRVFVAAPSLALRADARKGVGSEGERNAVLFVLLVIAFGWGTAVAAAWEALSDMDGRGVMDSTW
jgi:hypothetical protein